MEKAVRHTFLLSGEHPCLRVLDELLCTVLAEVRLRKAEPKPRPRKKWDYQEHALLFHSTSNYGLTVTSY